MKKYPNETRTLIPNTLPLRRRELEPGYRHGLLFWRMARRWLFVLACLATLTGLFYAVENWRGKRAWEKCRRELEAKGEVIDWNAFIPAPVPDEQNIFKAPRMTEWFVKGVLDGGFPARRPSPAIPTPPSALRITRMLKLDPC